jgi:hypothetical protein
VASLGRREAGAGSAPAVGRGADPSPEPRAGPFDGPAGWDPVAAAGKPVGTAQPDAEGKSPPPWSRVAVDRVTEG